MLVSCPRREVSTHAPQALEMLNGEFANAQAKALSERLLKEAGPNPKRQIDLAYRIAIGRPPKEQEMKLALEFLKAQTPLEAARAREQFALAMFNLNAFLYMN